MKNLLPQLTFILLLLAFANCEKPKLNVLQTLVIEKDAHRAKPYHFEWNRISYRYYRWNLTESCLYDHQGEDQCDWNKLTGDAQELLDNHDNSSMVAWRQPVAEVDSFQLGPYYHRNGITYHPIARCNTEGHQVDESLPLVWVRAGESFETHENIDENRDRVSFYVENLVSGTFYFHEVEFPEFERTREIGPWFGGNLAAPHDMYIVRVLLAEE